MTSEKRGLSDKNIKDYLRVACIRKISIDIIYDSNHYQYFFANINDEYIILDPINSDDINKISSVDFTIIVFTKGSFLFKDMK